MLKFHRDIVWSFHYRYNVYFNMLSSSERNLKYATKNGAQVTVVNLWRAAKWRPSLKGITQVKFTGTSVAYVGKSIWTMTSFPGGVHSSRRQFLEECAPSANVVTVIAVFPIHATHVPLKITPVMPFTHKKHTTLRCSLHVEDSNMRGIFAA